jgi:SepF-like predicted cell division protein (DUF552 family)
MGLKLQTNLKMGIFNKLKYWLMSKDYLINELIQLTNKYNYKIDSVAPMIEELDQSKIYYIKIENIDDIAKFKDAMRDVSAKIKWSLPMILISNVDMENMKVEEITRVYNQIKKKSDKYGKSDI